jgi:hypothetical protein
MPLCPAFFIEMGFSQTFCLGWPQTAIFFILTSEAAKTIGMSHWRIILPLEDEQIKILVVE